MKPGSTELSTKKPAKSSKITKFGHVSKVEHADYQLLHRLLSKSVFLAALITNYLQDFKHWLKLDPLIISVFHFVPGVPRVKMERFAGQVSNLKFRRFERPR